MQADGDDGNQGGLFVPKREAHVFKAPPPRTSLLGKHTVESLLLVMLVI